MKHIFIDQSDERIISLLAIIEQLSNTISEIGKTKARRPLNGELYFTDKELSERLKISRRTVQEWRYGGLIPYFQIARRIIFRESDIQALLDKNYRKAFR